MTEDRIKELEYVKEILEKEKVAIQSSLKTGLGTAAKAELIGKINLINFSQELLRRCFEYEVIPRAIWRRVPMPQHEWSEYRLMEDFDSSNKDYWREEPTLRLSGGEVIIG